MLPRRKIKRALGYTVLFGIVCMCLHSLLFIATGQLNKHVSPKSLWDVFPGGNLNTAQETPPTKSYHSLANRVQKACQDIQEKATRKFFTILGVPNRSVLYCPVEKVGTTFWRRILYVATLIDPSKYQNPFHVPDNVMDGVNKILTVKDAREEFNISQSTWENSFTFLFSRNPYTRIYSAFVDKLVAPDPYFWTELGAKASVARKSNGHNVTFAEFVRYIIKCLERDTNIDAHFVPIFDKCSPCEVKYKYIGKLEQFSEDAKYVFESIGQYSHIKQFSSSKISSSLAESAALNQTISVPYVSRNTIRNIISWKTALKRIWLKLQLRGLVAFDKKIEDFVSSTEFDSISADELIKRANKAKSLSNWTTLKQQKHEAMREAYMTLHINDVNMLRNLYKNDFKIFGYDDRPDNLFKRQPEPIGETKYLDYYKWV